MAVFFLVATAIYGGVHAYVWWKTTGQLGLRGAPAALLALFFAAVVVAPFLGRLLRNGSALFNAVELATFLWMGIVFYLFCFNLGADAWNLVAGALRLVTAGAGPPGVGGPRLFAAIAGATALVVGWAAVEAQNVRIRRLEVPSAKLAAGSPPVRIVQVSDVHLGMLLGPRRLSRILNRVREARPDLLVATGDMLDAVGAHLEPLAAMWRGVEAPLGKLAITGNHEYYTGIPGALAFLEGAGFRVLRDETAVAGPIAVVGAEYRPPPGLPGAPARTRSVPELLAEAGPARFRLLLKHLPTGFEEEAAPGGADLQLSGHTHDGQMYPFRWLVRLSFPHTAGLFRAGASRLYVSRGTGTWGPPLRFLAPPEVTLIELVPATP
jgi:predicted MPP superfamily phosphohydrolase